MTQLHNLWLTIQTDTDYRYLISSGEEAKLLANTLHVDYTIEKNFFLKDASVKLYNVPYQTTQNLYDVIHMWRDIHNYTYAGLTFTEFAIMMGYI